MSGLTIRICDDEDLDLLAEMNKQLIEDEKHDNKLNICELRERMSDFIHTEYNAYIFEKDGEVIGYALINFKRDPLYLRHFLIHRNALRQNYGTEAYHQLLKTLKTDVIDIEVMVWNERGKRFWASLGFKERSIYMRYNREEKIGHLN